MTKLATRLFLVLCMTASVVACTNPAVDITNRALDSRDLQAYKLASLDVVYEGSSGSARSGAVGEAQR